MKKNLLLRWAGILLILFTTCSVFAQNRTIHGSVRDNVDNSGIAGATVLIKGTSNGTKTDASGKFTLSVPASSATVTVSFIGYTNQQINVAGRSDFAISLVPSATALNEVQVVSVGYGSQRKKDITGAVANVSAKDFNKGEIINPLSQIQGKVAGLAITIAGGDPNSNASVRLRGQSSLSGGQTPLFVVDGIQLDDPTQFQNIPPGDIESYDVLKDASATAIYGSRGANGVILVNTKRGKSGKATVDYSGSATVSNQSKYYDLLSASEFRAANPKLGVDDHGGNTDWQKAMGRTAYTHSHNVAVSGGTNTFNYRASVNYQNQQGIMINTGKEQTGLRFSAQQKALNDKLVIDLGISNVTTNRKLFDNSNYLYIFNSPPTNPIYNAVGSNTIDPIKNPVGSYYAYTDFAQANPVMHQNMEVNTRNEHLNLMNGSINYEITKGLKIGSTGSISDESKLTHQYTPSYRVENNFNSASQFQENRGSKKGDIHLNFDRTFGRHTINATGVYEYNQFNYSNLSAGAQQLMVGQNLDNNLGTGNLLYNSIGSYKEEYKLISFLGRVNYNYADKIYATASIRRDGSSKFGSSNVYGYFPAVSLAYRIKKDFLKDVSWIDDLKIRAGYGMTGNSDAISPYSTLSLYGPGGRYFDAANGAYPQSYGPIQNPNQHLRWEERTGRNIGLDFSLFGGRLTGDANYFNDKTTHLLYNYAVPTPPFVIGNILANVGNLTNKGFELVLTGQIVQSSSFNWSVTGNISNPKTRLTSLSGTFDQSGVSYPLITNRIPVGTAQGRGLSATPITYLIPGSGPYTFYLPHFTGVNSKGEQLLDGKTTTENPNPKSYYTDPAAKFTYGFTNNFSYKRFALSIFMNGVSGSKGLDNQLLNIENINRMPGENVTKAALTNGIKDAAIVSDKWLENTSFLRLQNASLSYSFGSLAIPGVSAMRLSLSGNNLFVITKYRGQDPEIQIENGNGSSNLAYIDVSYNGQAHYPKSRSFTLGINITLK